MSSALDALTLRRIYDAPREHIFAALSTPSQMAQWFSPSPDIPVEVALCDFREGGAYRLCYTLDDGSKACTGGIYQVIRPPAQLVFTWMWEEPDPHAGMQTLVTIDLITRGSATELVLTHEHFTTADAVGRHTEG